VHHAHEAWLLHANPNRHMAAAALVGLEGAALGDRKSQLPMHGGKELGKGLVNKILKDLGLK